MARRLFEQATAISQNDHGAKERLNDAEHQRTSPTIKRAAGGRSSPIVTARADQRQRRLKPGAIAVVQLQHRVAGSHLVAGLRLDHDPHREIDGILHPVAPRAQRHRRAADELRVEPRQVAAARRRVTTWRSATCGSRE